MCREAPKESANTVDENPEGNVIPVLAEVLSAVVPVVFLSSLLQDSKINTSESVIRENVFFIINIVCVKVTGKEVVDGSESYCLPVIPFKSFD
jgi:hypothetical protein